MTETNNQPATITTVLSTPIATKADIAKFCAEVQAEKLPKGEPRKLFGAIAAQLESVKEANGRSAEAKAAAALAETTRQQLVSSLGDFDAVAAGVARPIRLRAPRTPAVAKRAILVSKDGEVGLQGFWPAVATSESPTRSVVISADGKVGLQGSWTAPFPEVVTSDDGVKVVVRDVAAFPRFSKSEDGSTVISLD